MTLREMSPCQRAILKAVVQDRQSVFVSGEAGTGKSFLVEAIRQAFASTDVSLHVTSTTGVSAFHLRGVTLHSCVGLGVHGASDPLTTLIRRVRRNRPAADRVRTMDALLIDEVSMLSASLWERLDDVFRALRGQADTFFGGCQIIVLGDFFQLLPVFDADKDEDQRLAFESAIWQAMFGERTFVLTKNFRQRFDRDYASLLQRIRKGHRVCHADLVGPSSPSSSETVSRDKEMYLVPTRKRARALNEHYLAELDGEAVTFDARFTGSPDGVQELRRQFEAVGLLETTFKTGCRVMLIANLDVSAGLVNGALGTVRSVGGPLGSVVTVHFDCADAVIPVTRREWKVDNGAATASQFPLILAYALTIHKSQSLTLDAVTVELGNCFAPHQAYVALSRVRCLSGLRLRSLATTSVFCDPRVVEYDHHLLSAC